MNEENELNPTIVEEESSTAYDPFEAARQMDEAIVAEKEAQASAQQEQPETPNEEPQPEAKPEEPAPVQEAPKGRQLSDEEYEQLVRLANIGKGYEEWSQSDEGKSATEFVQKRRNELAEKAKAEAEANPYDAAVAKFGEVNKAFFGDNPPELQNAMLDLIREEAKKQIQETLGPQMQELDFAKQGRINAELNKMADDYTEYLQDGFGMTAEEARNITNKKLGEMVKSTPYNKEAYIRELKGFAGGELLMASKNIAKVKDEEIASLKQKLAQFQQNPQAVAPSTSTAAAAERVLGQSDADYKRNGGIPTGATGAPNGGYVDEGAEAIAFLRGY